MTKEGGGFTLNGEDVADGAPVTGEENGLAYKLALADGKWAAEYQAASASVMLGQLGGTLALSQNEDKTWSAGGEALPENLTVPGDNGLHYKLALGEDGAWSAEYQAASASVMLGQLGGTLALSQNVAVGLAGSLPLYRAEDGSWSASPEPGGDPVASGDAYTAAFRPDTVTVSGAPLAASTLEGGKGWTLSDPASGASAELAASGDAGDADLQGSLYRVLATDDGLRADRYDLPIKGSPFVKALKPAEGAAAKPSLSADNADTPADEGGTELLVGGTSFDIGRMLDDGSDTRPRDSDPTFVEDAVKDLVAIRGVMEALVENLTGADDRTNLTNALTTQWNKADDVIKSVFGKKGLVEQGVADTTPRRAVGALQDVIDALSSAADA